MRGFLWIVSRPVRSLAVSRRGCRDLTIEDVRTMAFDKGVVTIKEIELDHGI